MTNCSNETLLALTADVVASHVAHNSVSSSDLPILIKNVFTALSGLGSSGAPDASNQQPAVSVRASIKPDYLVCLEDGKKLKMLKRHLMAHYQMTPADYRAKWKLPPDYPMVAPNYASHRRLLAHQIGLGRKVSGSGEAGAGAKPKAANPAADASSTPARGRGRPRANAES